MDRMEYISKINKEFPAVKYTGYFDSCNGILACPKCDNDFTNNNIAGWGMVSSIKESNPEPAMLYKCELCSNESFTYMSPIHMYYLLKEKFGG